MRSKIAILALEGILLISLFGTAKASQFNIVSFTHGVVGGVFEFQEEAYPGDTIPYNLSLIAYFDVTIYNLTLTISGLVEDNWQKLHSESILAYSMTTGQNFTKQIMITLPQKASGQLHTAIEVSTDKGFGETVFHATWVRMISFDELLLLYNELLFNYSALVTDYNQLLENYNTLNSTHNSILGEYNSIQTDYDTINSSYGSLNASYNSLTMDLGALQDDYTYIKTKYDASLAELSIVRSLMYLFTVLTVVFVGTTIYFRKKAPYIVVNKRANSNRSGE